MDSVSVDVLIGFSELFISYVDYDILLVGNNGRFPANPVKHLGSSLEISISDLSVVYGSTSNTGFVLFDNTKQFLSNLVSFRL